MSTCRLITEMNNTIFCRTQVGVGVGVNMAASVGPGVGINGRSAFYTTPDKKLISSFGLNP